MTVPEWVMILLVGSVLAVIGWGAKRLVKANDDTSVALAGINRHLGTMNGRLGKTEVWMEQHESMDDERHRELTATHKEMWHAINEQRK